MKWSELKKLIDENPDVNDETEIMYVDVGSGDFDEIEIRVNTLNYLHVVG